VVLEEGRELVFDGLGIPAGRGVFERRRRRDGVGLEAHALLDGRGELAVNADGAVELRAELGLEGGRRHALDHGPRDQDRRHERDQGGHQDRGDDAPLRPAEDSHAGLPCAGAHRIAGSLVQVAFSEAPGRATRP
jgi:hypothetical protein